MLIPLVLDLLTQWLPAAPIAAAALGCLLALPLLLVDTTRRPGRVTGGDRR